MLNCIIIDDEEMSRKSLAHFCNKLDYLNVKGDFENPLNALALLKNEKIDLIFLDIHMPDFSGFDFLKSQSTLPQVIITTTDKSLALDAFEFNVIDYLIKPVNLPRLIKAVDKLRNQSIAPANNSATGEKADHIYVNIDRRFVKIMLDKLLFVEAQGDYILLQTEDKKLIVHTTLQKIEDKLPNHMFVKTHRSYIINIDKIIDIEDNSILIGQKLIPISRSNRKNLTDRLNLI